jgi:hypothetical protein
MTQYTGLQYNDTTVTLGGILQDIYFNGKCNVNSLPAGDFLRIVNKYYAQCQEVIRSVNENFYMVQATTDLAIGDGSYTYPDGTGTAPAYEKLKSIWVSFLPLNKITPLSTEYTRVDIIDPDSIEDPSYEFSGDAPKAMMFGTYFVLLPLVTDVTKYPVKDGIKIYYIATQDKLVNNVDVPKIFPSFHDAIVHGSLIDVATRLGNDKLKTDSIALFAKRLAEIKSYASAHIPDQMGMVEGQDNLGGWEFPFGNNSMS